MRKALGFVFVLLVVASCKDQICNCPAGPGDPGWCHKDTPNAYECSAVCGTVVLCPGYCLPDGGNPFNPVPVPCDGGR
jgi:hypothetical protein